MNSNMLRAKMKLYSDTVSTLARSIGLSAQRLSAKINETHGAEFTQSEIEAIRNRYSLTAQEITDIFFANKVSQQDTSACEKQQNRPL